MRLVCVLLIAALCHADDLFEARRLAASKDKKRREAGIAMLVEANNAEAARHLLNFLERDAARIRTLLTRHEKEHKRTVKELEAWAKLLQKIWDKLTGVEPRKGMEAVLEEQAKQEAEYTRAWVTEARTLVAAAAVTVDMLAYEHALIQLTDPSVLPEVEKRGAATRDSLIRKSCLQLVCAHRQPTSVPFVLSLLEHDDPRARADTAERLRPFLAHEGVLEALTARLDDPSWAVRTRVHEQLAWMRLDKTLPILLKARRGEGGELARRIDSYLLRSTGFAGTDDGWRAWLAQHAPALKAGTFKAPKGGKLPGLPGVFFGLPVVSKRVWFVIEISDWASGRFAKIQTQLEQALDALAPDALFNICVFGMQRRWHSRRMVKPSAVKKAAALKWLKRFRPKGPGFLSLALEDVFPDYDSARHGKKRFLAAPDTVYLVAGSPPKDEKAADSYVLRVDSCPVTIHTVTLGAAEPSKILRSVAKRSRWGMATAAR